MTTEVVYGEELGSPPPTTTASQLLNQNVSYGQNQLSPSTAVLPSLSNTGNYTTSSNSSIVANLSSLLSDLAVETTIGTADGTAVNTTSNVANNSSATAANSGFGGNSTFQNDLIIPLYAIVFLLSLIGNSIVILMLVLEKRMRSVINVYLLNLAMTDLLLGVFCLPFTLVGQVQQNFIFGRIMCKVLPYFQAVIISVAVWTQVAIALERFFAICRPLSSRRWQSQSHASKMIALVWILSFLVNSPLFYVQQLQPITNLSTTLDAVVSSIQQPMECSEIWPSKSFKRAYEISQSVWLLFLPLVTMVLTYSMIMSKIWRRLHHGI
ncbi:cholecystokinin receptor-like isoform X2 [Armigeres subalbatus]